jgi:hypothetical protein
MDWHGTDQYAAAHLTNNEVQSNASNNEPIWLISGNINSGVSHIGTLRLTL